ncbi:MAG: ankyrin repeat domain-containing protein [Phycisphaerae bacterium]|nr:ankyrin repeat domain-containing protein [Phycisphaerae bacterium]
MNHMINNLLTALNNVGEAFCEHAAGVFVQTAFLVILLYAVDLLLRKRVRAVFRYCVWLLVLAKLVLPPTLSLPTGVGYWAADHLPSAMNVSSRPFDAPGFEYMGTSGERPHTGPSDDVAESAPLVVAENAPLTALTWQAILFILWLVGVLAFLALLVQRARFVRGLIVASTPATAEFAGVLEQCRRRIGVRWNTSVRISDTIPSPAVCGFFRPTIVIPVTLVDKLSPDGLKAILIHELAHIKRGDLWVNSIQTFLQIAYFYNPFVWFANSIIRRVCEEAVDETVLVALGGRAKDYSNTLIDIGEMAFWKADLALRLIGVAESRKVLQWRIRHMLTRPIPKSSKLGALGIAILLVFAAVLLPMARAEKSSEVSGTTAVESERELAKSLLKAANTGKVADVKSLISRGVDVNAKNAWSQTALHYAASNGHKEIVKVLLAHGADVNAGNHFNLTPARLAMEAGHIEIVELLISKGADVTPLHLAVHMKDLAKAKSLIEGGADVNKRTQCGTTPLHTAAIIGSKNIAKLLIDKGADVNANSGVGWTPLHEAGESGQKDVAELLIAKGADVNAKEGEGWTALHYAAHEGHKDMVELLITKGADVNAKNGDGEIPLHRAARRDHKDVTELLIAKGANVNASDKAGRTPVMIEFESGRVSMVDLLIAKGADVPVDLHAAYRGDLTWINKVVERGKARETFSQGLTLLHAAALGGHKEVVELLLSNDLDLHQKTDTALTALHHAAGANRKDVVDTLLARGADINAGKWTPLHQAVRELQEDMVQHLLIKGANPNAIGKERFTPLQWAVWMWSPEIAYLLISHGADVHLDSTGYGGTPLAEAIREGQPLMIEILLYGAGDTSTGGRTPLHAAALFGNREKAEQLIAEGANVNARDDRIGFTPLHWAVRPGGHKDVVELLVKKGADLDAKCEWDATPLFLAANRGHLQICELLITAGADLNVKDKWDWTVLSKAKQKGNTKIVELLRKHGARE